MRREGDSENLELPVTIGKPARVGGGQGPVRPVFSSKSCSLLLRLFPHLQVRVTSTSKVCATLQNNHFKASGTQ